ncbi:MAG TPA: prepilin-type N-terminal cleavage/methylation domain-containing protein [bacterium]|mgnify:CR=1 FL=1|nr:prepilin-type N-terminal cleavage/methylation domain-containing protein [bacterium]HPP30533.1 prepilin-type N-terminal cleavage/methylation domain-containing protein [bacterium]
MKWGNNGFSIIEILIVLLIFSLLMIPTTMYFLKYQRASLLESSAGQIIEIAEFARASALNERKEFCVVFDEEGFVVLREKDKPVDKKYKFPDHIKIKDKSEGFSPLVFNPDGTAKTGGYLILTDTAGKKEIKIVLHNLTGRCFIVK